MATSNELSVLYVEDEPLARWTGAKMIEPLVGRLVAVASCAEAESCWAREKFDLIISDYRLEDGLASDMVARMRDAGYQTPVICLSGESEDLTPDAGALSVNFARVLSKPLDMDVLSQTLLDMCAGDQPLAAGMPTAANDAADASPARACVTPLWVSPEWELSAAGDEGRPYFTLAAGRKGGLWILLYDCIVAHAGETRSAERIDLMFRQLAGWLPAAATADRMLDRCYDGLRRMIDVDYDWALAVLHLCGGRATFARGLDTRAWRVWLLDSARQWMPLTDWSAGAHPRSMTACVAAAHGEGCVAETSEAFCEDTAFKCGMHGFYLRACPAQRLIKLAVAQLANPAFTFDLLQRLECSLTADGLPPLAVRRLACGLLDAVMAASRAGHAGAAGVMESVLTVEWKAGSITVSMPGMESGGHSGENRFFDAVAVVDGMTRLSIAAHPQNNTFDSMPASRRAGRDGAASGAGGLFDLEDLPPVLTGATARDMRERLRDMKRLALDCGKLRFVDQDALMVLREMAAERRLTTGNVGGNLCLLGCSRLMERLLHWAEVDRDVDLASDRAELEALARRVTSSSERASILESVVKW